MSKNLVVKVGEYEKDGQTKGRYMNIGVLMDGENGQYILLDPTVNLADVMIKQRVMKPEKAGDSVMVSVFDRDNQKQDAPSGGDPDNQDIPF